MRANIYENDMKASRKCLPQLKIWRRNQNEKGTRGGVTVEWKPITVGWVIHKWEEITITGFSPRSKEPEAHISLSNTGFLHPGDENPECLTLKASRAWIFKHVKKQRHSFANKGLSSQSYVFFSSHVRMWELDCKESWVLKNWCFWTVVLEKTLESPLDS